MCQIKHEIFIYSGIENGDYTGSRHYTVYKLNVTSQCSSVTAYLVVLSLFYQEYSFDGPARTGLFYEIRI